MNVKLVLFVLISITAIDLHPMELQRSYDSTNNETTSNSSDDSLNESEDQFRLHEAVYDKNIDAVHQLLKEEESVDTQDDENYTPLCLAAEWGYVDIANVLLEHGASVKAYTNNGDTPLHLAVAQNNTDMINFLLDQKGIEIDATDNNDHTPLCIAAMCGYNDTIEMLLEADADVHVRMGKGNMPFILAAIHCKINTLKFLFDYALRHPDIIQITFDDLDNALDQVLEKCADFQGDSLFDRYGEIITFLIQNGAKFNSKNNGPIIQRLYDQKPIILSMFFDWYENIVAQMPDASTEALEEALDYALCQGYGDILDALLSKLNQRKLNQLGEFDKLIDRLINQNEFFLQRESEEEDACRIEENLQKIKRNLHKRVNLHKAAQNANLETIKRFANKWNVNKTDSEGETPLHIAIRYSKPEVVRCLLEAGASLNYEGSRWNEEGFYSPLGLAAEQAEVEIVQLLLKHGSTLPNFHKILEAKDLYKYTALEAASRKYTHSSEDYKKKYLRIIELLLQYGATVSFRGDLSPEVVSLISYFDFENNYLNYTQNYLDQAELCIIKGDETALKLLDPALLQQPNILLLASVRGKIAMVHHILSHYPFANDNFRSVDIPNGFKKIIGILKSIMAFHTTSLKNEYNNIISYYRDLIHNLVNGSFSRGERSKTCYLDLLPKELRYELIRFFSRL